MSYVASPRPTFTRAAPIPRAATALHLWGDDESGEVADWIYVSSDKIHHLVFGLAVGGRFRHSDAFRTIFAADELLFVLRGTMVLANPETGEVHKVRQGEAASFGRDTWHHAWNAGPEPLRVLELFAPPPSQGTSGAYARSKPLLVQNRYVRNDLLGQWPGTEGLPRSNSIRVVREPDYLWRLEGTEHQTLVGVLLSTDQLTIGRIVLQPGERTDRRSHGGDASLQVLEGTLHVHICDGSSPSWFELESEDGFYLPEGTPYRLHNVSAQPVEVIFGVAPCYLPCQAS